MVVRTRQVIGRRLTAWDHRPVETVLAVSHVLAGFPLVVGRVEESLQLVGCFRLTVGELTVGHIAIEEPAATLLGPVRSEAADG